MNRVHAWGGAVRVERAAGWARAGVGRSLTENLGHAYVNDTYGPDFWHMFSTEDIRHSHTCACWSGPRTVAPCELCHCGWSPCTVGLTGAIFRQPESVNKIRMCLLLDIYVETYYQVLWNSRW